MTSSGEGAAGTHNLQKSADEGPPATAASSNSSQDMATLSDPENGEKPVREQLKNTTIAGTKLIQDQTMSDNTGAPRKRTHTSEEEDDHDHDTPPEQRHVRKKSKDRSGSPRDTTTKSTDGVQTEQQNGERPSTPPTNQMTEDKENSLTSPKNKRAHDAAFVSTDADAPKPTSTQKPSVTDDAVADPKTTAEGGPKPKRQKDILGALSAEDNTPQQASAKPPSADIGSGFSNTGTQSPFGALSKSQPSEEQPQTSKSAFAASGFGAMSSVASPFASVSGNKTQSPFAAASAKSPPLTTTTTTPLPPTSGFGASLNDTSKRSPFAAVGGSPLSSFASAASASSGFVSLGGTIRGGFSGGQSGGFGGASGPKLSSSARHSGPPIVGLSAKPAKAFGAQEDDDEDDEGDESGAEDGGAEKSTKYNDEGKKDGRFYKQDVETGEESEETVFSCRAKLYNFVKVEGDRKEWKERGLGVVKLNVKDNGDTKSVRFIMRAEGSHRVILNSPIKKEINVGDPQGGRPNGQNVYFSGSIDNKPDLELMQLKVRQPFAEELYDRIVALKKEM